MTYNTKICKFVVHCKHVSDVLGAQTSLCCISICDVSYVGKLDARANTKQFFYNDVLVTVPL